MPHPNGRKPLSPLEFSPHTAKQRAAQYAAKEAKRQRKAARRSGQNSRGSNIPWKLIKFLLMTFPIWLALYVILTD